MKGILAACVAAVVVVGAARADDKKIDPAKLVGKWEWTKSDDPGAPKGAIVEFTKDNKMSITFKVDAKEEKIEGTYKVDGDKLTVKMSFPGGKDNEDTDTIQSLTDDKLVLVDKDKKTNELTKKK
jgi:uncharacterized protein (TIGR03066 family)